MRQPVCAIVGIGEGLGHALATKFASQGIDIVLILRSEANSAAAIKDVTATTVGANVQFFPADAAHPKTIGLALTSVAEDMGEVNVLIYNARGEFTAGDPLEMSYGEVEDVCHVEVFGAFSAAKYDLPDMIKRSKGSVFFQVHQPHFTDHVPTRSMPLVSSGYGHYHKALPRPTLKTRCISCI